MSNSTLYLIIALFYATIFGLFAFVVSGSWLVGALVFVVALPFALMALCITEAGRHE